MKNNVRVKVDKEKVKELIEKTGLNGTKISKSIGRNNSFISKILNDESPDISKVDYLFIKEKYNVDIEEKTKPKKSERIKKDDNDCVKYDASSYISSLKICFDEDSLQTLQKTITNANADTFANLPLTEISNFIEQAVYRGVKKALDE